LPAWFDPQSPKSVPRPPSGRTPPTPLTPWRRLKGIEEFLHRIWAGRFSLLRLVALVFFWGGLSEELCAQQFQFFLRNGDRLTGSVVAEDKESVIITNGVIGRILIPAGQVERREAIAAVAPAAPAQAVAVAPAPPTTAPAGVSAAQQKRLDDLVQVYLARQISANEFERRQADILNPAKGPAPKRWSGELFAGVDLGYGTKSRQFFSGRAKINYVQKRFRNTFDYLFTYGHTEGELAANRMDATDKIDYELESRYYLYAQSGAGYDQIRRIESYLQAGPGVGKHLIQRTNLVFNAEVGASYQQQDFEDGNDTFLFYYRLAQDMKWTITPKLSFDEKIEYTPQWNDVAEFKIRGEANLRYWLMNNLSLNLTVIDLYDTRVAEGIHRNDLQIRSSIGVKF